MSSLSRPRKNLCDGHPVCGGTVNKKKGMARVVWRKLTECLRTAVENPLGVSVEDEDKSSKEESEMECAAVDGEIEGRIGEVPERPAVRKRWNGRA
ncbi:hypothetical protein SLE2022_348110 [Rubroshorea leprosula]